MHNNDNLKPNASFASVVKQKNNQHNIGFPNKEPPPPTLLLEHDGTKYRLFFTTDNMTCFSCKQVGHLASKCPKKEQPQQNNPLITVDVSTKNNNQGPSQTKEIIKIVPTNTTDETSNLKEHNKEDTKGPYLQPPTENVITQKRTRLSSGSTEDFNDFDEIEMMDDTNENENDKGEASTQPSIATKVQKKIKNKPIRFRSVSPKSLESINTTDLLKQETTLKKKMMEKPEDYVFTYDTLVDFLENVKESNNILDTAKEYTKDVESLLKTLGTIHQHLQITQSRYRITRLKTEQKNKLKTQTQ